MMTGIQDRGGGRLPFTGSQAVEVVLWVGTLFVFTFLQPAI